MGVVNAPRATGYDACVQQTSRGRMVGLAGTLLLAVSAWLASPWGLGFAGRSNPLPIRWAHTLPAALGVVLLFAGWLMMRGTDQKNAWRTFAVWCLPLLVRSRPSAGAGLLRLRANRYASRAASKPHGNSLCRASSVPARQKLPARSRRTMFGQA